MEKLTIYTLIDCYTCNKILEEHPDYKVFWRSGYAYRGAAEVEDDKSIDSYLDTFEERMQRRYNWAVAIDITIDHEKKEIHLNGFSENDLY